MILRHSKVYITIITAIMLNFIVSSYSSGQDFNILDPLNLKEPTNQTNPPEKRISNVATTITAIIGDNDTQSMLITGIPEVRPTVNVNDRIVEIRLSDSILHKRLASPTYNWNHKLTSQLPELVQAMVKQDDCSKEVVITLKFKTTVAIEQYKSSSNRITFTFQDLKNSYSNELNIRRQKKSRTVINQNSNSGNINSDLEIVRPWYSPSEIPNSNNFVAVTPSTKAENEGFNGKLKIQKQQSIEEIFRDIAPELPQPVKPRRMVSGAAAQPDYSRSFNNHHVPVRGKLSPLDKPEEINNKLNNASDYDSLLRLAYSLEAEKNLKEAQYKLTQAINVDSSRYEAYSSIGDLYFREGKYDSAIESYEKTLSINPSQSKVMFNLGSAYTRQQQTDKALGVFEKLLEMQPDNFEINNNIAYIHYLNQDYDNAIKYYQDSLQLVHKKNNIKEEARIHYNLANAYKAKNDLSNAVKEYKESIKKTADFADAHYNLAATYVDLKDYTRAIVEFEAYTTLTLDQSEIDRVNDIISKLKNRHS